MLQPNLHTGNIVFFNTQSSTPQFATATTTPKIIKRQAIYLQQRKEMLKNYREYVQRYNDGCIKLNQEIAEYNNQVTVFIEQNKLQDHAATELEMFKAIIGKVSIAEYNAAAKLENERNNELVLELKKYQPIRKALEHTFAMILFEYAMQIDEKTAILSNLNATTTRAIQRLKINHHSLCSTEIDGVLTLPYTKRTMQNHVNRLFDAGVLFDYSYHGSEKPIQAYLNPQILVVFDEISKKTLKIENQLLTSGVEKNFHNKKIDTRTFLNKIEIIENVDKHHSQDKGESQSFQLMQSLNSDIYKNTNQAKELAPAQLEVQETKQAAAKKFNKNSEFLEDNIQDGPSMMQHLSDGNFASYRFNIRNHIEKEAHSYEGTMSKERFRLLLLQTFIKIAAPIWKNHKNVSVATYYKAWNLINEQFLLNPNGSIPNKANQLYYFDNLVWRITNAKSFFNTNPDYKALYPGQYFDPTRKTSKSGGFAYTINALKRHEVDKRNAHKRQDLLNAAAAQRNKKYKAIELVEKKINALKNGKITIIQLHDYVEHNAAIPPEIKAKLPSYVQRIYKA